jgi:hypothetical protein
VLIALLLQAQQFPFLARLSTLDLYSKVGDESNQARVVIRYLAAESNFGSQLRIGMSITHINQCVLFGQLHFA